MRLAGQDDGLQGVGQLVDVEDGQAVEPGDLVQVEVVGDDLGVHRLGQLDELGIDVADVGEIQLGDDDRDDLGGFLEVVEDVEAAPAALALQPVRRSRPRAGAP